MVGWAVLEAALVLAAGVAGVSAAATPIEVAFNDRQMEGGLDCVKAIVKEGHGSIEVLSAVEAAIVTFEKEETADAARPRLAQCAGVKSVRLSSEMQGPEVPVQVVGPDAGGVLHDDDDDDDDGDGDGGAGGRRHLAARGPRAARRLASHIRAEVHKLHEAGVTGEGVNVAIIDSGIDLSHDALVPHCFGPHKRCLVQKGYDYVDNKPKPMDPCGTHGTHVAGIVATQAAKNPYGFSGAAPGVKLFIYRALGCKGTGNSDDVLRAVNQAVADGAHIISMSLGDESGRGEPRLQQTLAKLANDTVCVQAQGNDGHQGFFLNSAFAPGVAHVANARSRVTFDEVSELQYLAVDDGGGGRVDGVAGFARGTQNHWPSGWMPLWSGDACDAAAIPRSLYGHVGLVHTGGDEDRRCHFDKKISNMQARGARHFLAVAPAPRAWLERYNVQQLDRPQHPLEAIATVGWRRGRDWHERLQRRQRVYVMMPLAESTKSFFYPLNTTEGDGMSVSTNLGPGLDGAALAVKPQFAAPGSSILSTYPTAKGSYALASGTSMACPLVAAAYALLMHDRVRRGLPRLPPADMTHRLAITAKPAPYFDGKKVHRALAAPVAQQGNGIIKVWRAARTPWLVSPASVSLGDAALHANRPSYATLEVENLSDAEGRCRIRHWAAATLYTLAPNNVYAQKFPFDAADDAAADVRFDHDWVDVPPGGRGQFRVAITAPQNVDEGRLPYWSGHLRIVCAGFSLTVAYQGVGGSLGRAIVLRQNDTYMSLLTDRGKLGQPVRQDHIYYLPRATRHQEDPKLPLHAIGLALDSAVVHALVIADPHNPLDPRYPPPPHATILGTHTLGEIDFFPWIWSMNRGLGGRFWRGVLNTGVAVPSGRYKIKTMALRRGGDEKNPNDYDVSETEWFRIQWI